MKKIFYIILGGIIFSTITVLAATTLSSNEVFYKRVNNQDMTVQQALDDLYTKTDTITNLENENASLQEQLQAAQAACPSGSICISNADFGTPQYYAFDENNPPTTSSTTNYTTLKTNVYVGLYEDNQYGVCINRNGTQHCFRYDNWFAEREHLQEVFSGANNSCDVQTTAIYCDAPDFRCNAFSYGLVNCLEHYTDSFCVVNGNGSVNCS